jgi:hypothetical protein
MTSDILPHGNVSALSFFGDTAAFEFFTRRKIF